jgi:AcrR family transcriptional regulator
VSSTTGLAKTGTGGGAARVRLSPEQRRTQLLELGVELLSERAVDEISIDLLAEQAGVSRGLVHHYFGTLVGYREAVVRHWVDQLIEATAPPAEGEPLERLLASLTVYVDYVVDNFGGYVSIVRGAAGGTDVMREIYEEARAALTDRIFRQDAHGEILPDTPATRLVVRGWSAMVEETVLVWAQDPTAVSRDELLAMLAGSLPAMIEMLGERAHTPGGASGTA